MTRDEVVDEVREIFHGTLKVDPSRIRPETNLKDDLQLDSLDVIEVVYEIEDRFDVQIPEEQVKELATFDQIVDGLWAAVSARG